MIQKDAKSRRSIHGNSKAMGALSLMTGSCEPFCTPAFQHRLPMENLLRDWVLTNFSRACGGNDTLASTDSKRLIRPESNMPTDKPQVLPFRSHGTIEPILGCFSSHASMGLVLMERKVYATANDIHACLSQRLPLQASAVCKPQNMFNCSPIHAPPF